jgi:AraC-like DNA-binding protein
MIEHGLSHESRRAEKSRIAANWLARMRQCMTNGDEPQILKDAMRNAQITPSHLDGRLTLSQQQLDKVITYTIRLVPDISLRMFARAEMSDLGVMGYAAINSDTVGKAITLLNRYHELTSDRYIDSLTIDDDTVVVTPMPVMSHIQEFKNIAEDCFAGNWRVLTLLLGDSVDLRAAHIYFDFPAPNYQATFAEVFKCPITFSADRNELRFPAAWLRRPIASANRTLADVCTAMCERLLGAGESSRETSQMVRRLLLSRPGRRMYRLEEAAAELRMSASQLRKRLYRAGTSYKELVLEIRMALAKHYLEDTDLAIQEIAYLLDYSQPAPFSRAFKSYYGAAPVHSKAELRQRM